jgi:hypothetical protein
MFGHEAFGSHSRSVAKRRDVFGSSLTRAEIGCRYESRFRGKVMMDSLHGLRGEGLSDFSTWGAYAILFIIVFAGTVAPGMEIDETPLR